MYMCCENARGNGGKPQPKPNPDSRRKTAGQVLHIKSQLNGDTHLHSHHFEGPNYVLTQTHLNI